MKQAWSLSWKSSTQPRKQRKFRYNAPMHVKAMLLGAHLCETLRTKYGKRSVRIRTEDTVKVLRGQFKGKEGVVNRVDIPREKIYVAGLERVKKDGTKVFVPIHPSNVVVTQLHMEDKKRVALMERKK